MSEIQAFNQQVIEDFRANGGVVGGAMDGMPLMLLHTIGAKSGQPRVNPLAYLADGDRWAIIASFAGASSNPPWYHNLLANPNLTIEVGTDTIDVAATVAEEPQRTELYSRMAALVPVFNEYQSRTERVIPVVLLARR